MDKTQIYNFLSTQSNIFEILRENDFKMAKEFWGDYTPCPKCKKVSTVHKGKCTTHYGWQAHLQQIILEKDPLAYMKNFIKE